MVFNVFSNMFIFVVLLKTGYCIDSPGRTCFLKTKKIIMSFEKTFKTFMVFVIL